MDDTPDGTSQPTSLDKVLAALAALGEAPAASISEHAGIGYSTTTPKLRELESEGRAERLRTDNGRILWRLTTPATGQPGGDATEQPTRADGEPVADDAPAAGETAVPDTDPADGEADDVPPHPAPQTAEANPTAEGSAGTAQPASGSTGEQGPPVRATDSAAPAEAPAADGGKGRRSPTNPKRPKGALRDAVLGLLQANPDTAYKVGEICRLLDRAAEGAGVNKASAGAVANALDKLIVDGSVRQVGDKPATFQAE